MIVATPDADALLALARDGGVPAAVIGETGGERLRIGPADPDAAPWIDRGVAELRAIWQRALPRRLSVITSYSIHYTKLYDASST